MALIGYIVAAVSKLTAGFACVVEVTDSELSLSPSRPGLNCATVKIAAIDETSISVDVAGIAWFDDDGPAAELVEGVEWLVSAVLEGAIEATVWDRERVVVRSTVRVGRPPVSLHWSKGLSILRPGLRRREVKFDGYVRT